MIKATTNPGAPSISYVKSGDIIGQANIVYTAPVFDGGDFEDSEIENIASDNGTDDEDIIELLKNSRDNAVYVRDLLMSVVNQKAVNICNRFKGILNTVEDMTSIVDYYKNTFSDNNDSLVESNAILSNMLKTYYGTSNETLIQNSSFFNNTSKNSYVANILKEIESSIAHPQFSTNKNYTNTQVKLMYKVLNKKNKNLHVETKRGKQTIFTIGITNNMLKTLQNNAFDKTGDIGYLSSNYIVIEMLKKQVDAVDENIFLPKYFVFDMSKYIFENIKNISQNQIENYDDNWNYDEIRKNMSLSTFSDQEKIFKEILGSNLIQNTQDDRRESVKQIIDNHIFDHYLKMYLTLLTSLQADNSAFPVYKNSISELKNVDKDKKELYSTFRNGILLKYPSINVDTDLQFEFGRLESQIKDSIFLKPKNKARHILTPKSFDRTFTFLVNEDDFVLDVLENNLDGSEIQNEYTVDVKNNISSKIEIDNAALFNYEGFNKAGISHKSIINEKETKFGIYQYFCNVSILKNIPKFSWTK